MTLNLMIPATHPTNMRKTLHDEAVKIFPSIYAQMSSTSHLFVPSHFCRASVFYIKASLLIPLHNL